MTGTRQVSQLFRRRGYACRDFSAIFSCIRQLVGLDVGYGPDRSVAQTLRLIEDDKVFALIGAVGTPTAMATIPITSARNIPFIGPFSGAEFLRDLELPNVVNIRASYGAE